MLTIFGTDTKALFSIFCTFEVADMGRFSKLRKNKKYGYKPRYYEDNGEGNPFKIKHKLDRYRTTVDAPGGIRLIVILLILLLIVLYILDFDLSIFFPQ